MDTRAGRGAEKVRQVCQGFCSCSEEICGQVSLLGSVSRFRLSAHPSRYMSNFPAQVRTNFFTEVDRRQAECIKRELASSASAVYEGPSSSSIIDCSSLSPPLAQLLLGEVSLLDNADIAEIIDATVTRYPTSPQPSLIQQGLTAVMVRLMYSPSESRRRWARSHLPQMARQPLNFNDWCDLGIGGQIQALYSDERSELRGGEKWKGLATILSRGLLAEDALVAGLLEGRLSMEDRSKKGKPLMAVLSSHLGASSTGRSSD